LKALFEENADESEKLTTLKSMGNLGSRELVAVLKTIIEDHETSPKIRLNAIYALRRLAKFARKQVRRIVVIAEKCFLYVYVFLLAVFLWALLPEIKWMMMMMMMMMIFTSSVLQVVVWWLNGRAPDS